jgi:serine/threonine protein kinase
MERLEPLESDDPRHVGPFTLIGRLGGGGMGMVFLGKLPSGRLAAIKLVHAHLAHERAFRERFRREVDNAKAVGGFFTAPIVDADPNAKIPWLATAYIDGPTLDDAVEDNGALSAEMAGTVLIGLAEALTAIHHAGVIHRDLKPSNIILAADGPRVIDFGIARALDDYRITSHGAVMGSPLYMSPEQAGGEAELTPASDVFALGSVLVFASSGHPPFHGGHVLAVLHSIKNTAPDLAGVPSTLAPIVAACLAKDPADRPGVATLLAPPVGRDRSERAGVAPERRDRWWLRRS